MKLSQLISLVAIMGSTAVHAGGILKQRSPDPVMAAPRAVESYVGPGPMDPGVRVTVMKQVYRPSLTIPTRPALLAAATMAQVTATLKITAR